MKKQQKKRHPPEQQEYEFSYDVRPAQKQQETNLDEELVEDDLEQQENKKKPLQPKQYLQKKVKPKQQVVKQKQQIAQPPQKPKVKAKQKVYREESDDDDDNDGKPIILNEQYYLELEAFRLNKQLVLFFTFQLAVTAIQFLNDLLKAGNPLEYVPKQSTIERLLLIIQMLMVSIGIVAVLIRSRFIIYLWILHGLSMMGTCIVCIIGFQIFEMHIVDKIVQYLSQQFSLNDSYPYRNIALQDSQLQNEAKYYMAQYIHTLQLTYLLWGFFYYNLVTALFQYVNTLKKIQQKH